MGEDYVFFLFNLNIPLQVKSGDLAVYLSKSGFDIEIKGEKYMILSHSAIVMIIREDGLFE